MSPACFRIWLSALSLSCLARTPVSQATPPSPAVRVSTSLPFQAGHEPALAFDSKLETFFTSTKPAKDGDDFLVTLPTPTELRQVRALTGTPNGVNQLVFGALEMSLDGTNFVVAAPLINGEARASSFKDPVRALRIRCTGAGRAPLSIREFILESHTPLPPVRFVTRVEVDYSHAPECQAFGTRAGGLAEEWYPRIRELLGGGGPPPYPVIKLTFLPMEGVASTSADHIRVSADWVTRKAPNDFGMVIHELTHVAQDYRNGGEGWLTEGIADYIRDYHFEPGARKIHMDPDKASYRDGYTTTAAFLEWLEDHKDAHVVSKLNAASRQRKPIAPVFQQATGLELDELWAEFVGSTRGK